MAAPCSRFCVLEPQRSSWPAGDRARPERTLVCAVLSQGWLCTQLVQSWGAGLGPRARPVLGRGSGQHQACRSLPSSHRPPSQLPQGEGLSGHSSSCPGLGWPMGARGGRRGWAGSREEAGPGAAAHGRRGCGRRGSRREELGGRPAAGRGCPRPAFRPSALPRPAPPASWAHLEMFDLIECRFTLQK